MSTRFLWMIGIAAVVALFATQPATALHDGDHGGEDPNRIFKIDKKSAVNLRDTIQLNGVTVTKGKYLVEHRVDGNVHFFTFTKIEKPKKGAVVAPVLERIDVRSKMVAATERVKNSRIHTMHEKEFYRVTKIEFIGEDLDHVF